MDPLVQVLRPGGRFLHHAPLNCFTTCAAEPVLACSSYDQEAPIYTMPCFNNMTLLADPVTGNMRS